MRGGDLSNKIRDTGSTPLHGEDVMAVSTAGHSEQP